MEGERGLRWGIDILHNGGGSRRAPLQEDTQLAGDFGQLVGDGERDWAFALVQEIEKDEDADEVDSRVFDSGLDDPSPALPFFIIRGITAATGGGACGASYGRDRSDCARRSARLARQLMPQIINALVQGHHLGLQGLQCPFGGRA